MTSPLFDPTGLDRPRARSVSGRFRSIPFPPVVGSLDIIQWPSPGNVAIRPNYADSGCQGHEVVGSVVADQKDLPSCSSLPHTCLNVSPPPEVALPLLPGSGRTYGWSTPINGLARGRQTIEVCADRFKRRPTFSTNCDGVTVTVNSDTQSETSDSRPATAPSRRARIFESAEANHVPLRTILVIVALLATVFVAAELFYRMRDLVILMLVGGFIALVLNPQVVALQRWRIHRRGHAVAIVTVWAVLVFIGLAFAFGYPLVNTVTHLADNLPGYVNKAEHGKGWIGHILRKYHLDNWVQKNSPKLVTYAEGLSKPALSIGRGAVSVLATLFTTFVFVILLLLEAPKMRTWLLGSVSEERAATWTRVCSEVSRSVSGYVLGDVLTSIIAGVVVAVTLAILSVPFALLWGLWVGLVDFLPTIGGALAGIPTVLFATQPLLHRRIGHRHCLRDLHAGREPHSESCDHEPHGQGQPPAHHGVRPGWRRDRKLVRWPSRGIRHGAPVDSHHRWASGDRARDLGRHLARAGKFPPDQAELPDAEGATPPDVGPVGQVESAAS